MTTEATTSTPDGTSVDQVSAVNALLAQELGFGADEPEEKDEEGANGDPDASTSEEEGDEFVEAQSEGEATWGGALGIDDSLIHLDDNGNVAGLKVKVDGVESTVPVKDLIAGYQTNKHFTQKSQALADERRQFEQTRDQVSQDLVSRLQMHDRLFQIQQQQLLKEFEGVQWDRLRAENPGEYAAMLEDFKSRKANLDNLGSALQHERMLQEQHQQAEFNRLRTEHLRTQYERTLANNPSWSDPAKLQADMAVMQDFAHQAYGITPEEYQYLDDARYIEILKDAMAFRKGQSLAGEKVANAPKFIKGGKSGKPMDRVTQLTLNAKKAKGANAIKAQALAVNELLAGL